MRETTQKPGGEKAGGPRSGKAGGEDKSPAARLRAAAERVRESARRAGVLWTATQILDRAGLGAMRYWPSVMVRAETLGEQIGLILAAWGMPEEDRAVTAKHLLYADRYGIDSHGCAMLLAYQREIRAGVLVMAPKIEVVRESTTTALIDGGRGAGQVVGDRAMKLAIAKCRESGVAAVAVRNSGHFGAAGVYATMAVEAGQIGVATTSTRKPSVVPTFGLEAKLGTNPIAFAAPAARNRPFLLDMATSTAPVGKLMSAWRSGRAIPPGWAQRPDGEPETNARRAFLGRRLTPLGSRRQMGSHKGYSLAAMVEILSSVLPGDWHDGGGAGRVGHFFFSLDPRRFRAAGEFETDLDGMMDSLRACKPSEAVRPVLVAGDPEYAAAEERDRTGIPLSRSVVEDIRVVCEEAGVAFLLDGRK